MTVLYPPWPPCVAGLKGRLVSNTGFFNSPLTGQSQPYVRPGAHWEFDVTGQLLDDTRMGAWQAFLEQLQETGSTTYWNWYPKARPLNYLANYSGTPPWGTPLVNGANQVGYSLVCDGLTVGASFLPGDCLAYDNGVYREMKRITAAVVANGSGQATFAINPAIRRSPANNASVYFDGHNTDPTQRMACEVMCINGQQAEWTLSGFQMTATPRFMEIPR